MQKKKEKIFDKIVKKDYNNELEEVLEKKMFDESVKNLLLSILYKIEVSYNDYKTIKRNVENKEDYIKNFIEMINKNCDDIKLVKMNTEEKNILGNKTFLIEKEKKRIICYPIERKLLYCISKISKNEKIVDTKIEILDESLAELLNVGRSIETVEPLRDFNGYSWTTIPKEIESIKHNLIYQNLRILLGYKFMNKWISKEEFMINYLDSAKMKLEENYDKKIAKDLIEEIKKISVLLKIKYDKNEKKKIEKEEKETKERLEKMQNKEDFVKVLTQDKKKKTEEIKILDETLNNKKMLQDEYKKRNEKLPLEKKIFSARILANMLIEEREQKIAELEKLNGLLNPKKYISYKKELEEKYKYLELINKEDIEKEIEEETIKIQKNFLKAEQKKVEKITEKQDLEKLMYEFRYYNLLPFSETLQIYEVKELKAELKQTIRNDNKKSRRIKDGR